MRHLPVEIRFSYQLTKKPGKYIKRGRKLVPYVPSKTAIAKRLGNDAAKLKRALEAITRLKKRIDKKLAADPIAKFVDQAWRSSPGTQHGWLSYDSEEPFVFIDKLGPLLAACWCTRTCTITVQGEDRRHDYSLRDGVMVQRQQSQSSQENDSN